MASKEDEERLQLIDRTKQLAVTTLAEAKANVKLGNIKGSADMINRIEEVSRDLEAQTKNILATMKSSALVVELLDTLRISLEEIHFYFEIVDKAGIFTSKAKLKRAMEKHYQTLTARCTQLLATVSLELLTDKPEPVSPQVSSELFNMGLNFFYGINGKPKNYTYAFEKFVQAAEFGEENAMIMTGKCYLKGYGVDTNEDAGWKWLEKAANSERFPQGKTELAILIVEKLKERNPRVIKDFVRQLMQDQDEDAEPHDGKLVLNAIQKLKAMSHKKARPPRDDDDEEDEDDEPSALDFLEQDLQTAIMLLLEAARQGHVEAKTHLGMIYEEAKDIDQAVKWYSLASKGGCAKGTVKLADLLLYGKGHFVGSRAKAFSLYTIASKSGEADAFNGLGLCYEGGIGTDPNLSMSIYNYRLGAEKGSAKAMYNLGYLLVKNAIEVIDTMKKMKFRSSNKIPILDSESSQLDHLVTAVTLYGDPSGIYEEHSSRADIELREGIRYLRSAAECKIDDAFYQLGRLYEQGYGLPLDADAAFNNYMAAAKLGHSTSAELAANLLYNRVDMYDNGIEMMAKLYKQAAEGGIARAMNNLGLLLEDGRASANHTKDVYAAAAWYFEACHRKYEKAFINLSMLLATDTIFSFQTIHGELVTLAEAMQFLEDHLPPATPDDDLQCFRTMMETIERKSKNTIPLIDNASHKGWRSAEQKSQLNPNNSHNISVASHGEEKSQHRHHHSHHHEPQDVSNMVLRSSPGRQHKSDGKVSLSGISVAPKPNGNTSFYLNQTPVDGTQRSGEIYQTNGAIPPPLYVPKPMQYSAPSGATKPAHARANHKSMDMSSRPNPPLDRGNHSPKGTSNTAHPHHQHTAAPSYHGEISFVGKSSAPAAPISSPPLHTSNASQPEVVNSTSNPTTSQHAAAKANEVPSVENKPGPDTKKSSSVSSPLFY